MNLIAAWMQSANRDRRIETAVDQALSFVIRAFDFFQNLVEGLNAVSTILEVVSGLLHF